MLELIPFMFLGVFMYGATILTYHKYCAYVQYHNYLCDAWNYMYKYPFKKGTNGILKDYKTLNTWHVAVLHNVRTDDLIKFIDKSFKAGLSEVIKKDEI